MIKVDIEIPNIIKVPCGRHEIGRELCYGLDEYEEWKLIEEGEFIQNGKCQYCTIIYFNSKYDCHYALDISRSGSPFTDWYYDYEDMKEIELYRVVKKEKIITEWVIAK